MSKKLEIIIQGKDELSGPVKQGEKALLDLSKTADIAGQKTDGMWKQVAGGAVVADLVTKGISKLASATVDFVKDSIGAYQESQKAETQLAAVLKSTGMAAGMSAKELKGLAGEMQKVTAFEDDAVLGAENVLLTFTKIGRDVFPKATESTLNIAQALGMDLQSAAMLVGKALNDPIKGITALTRSGITFTDAQKEMIKGFVEMGDVSKAQTIIIKELETQFGGSARAFAGTFEGQVTQLKNAWGDMQEEIGGGFADAFAPVLSDLKAFFEENREEIISFAKGAADALGDLARVAIWTIGAVKDVVGFIGKFNPFKILDPSALKAQMELYKNLYNSMRDASLSVVDAVSAAQAAGMAEAKKKEDAHWASIRALNERLKKDKLQQIEETSKAQQAAYSQEVKEIDSMLKSFYGVKETVLDQLKAHQANAQALGISGDMAERLANAIKDAQFRQMFEIMPKGAKNTAESFKDMVPPAEKTFDFTKDLNDNMGDIVDKSKDVVNQWDSIGNAIGDASEILAGMTDLLDGIGQTGLADITNQLSNITQGAAGAFGSFATGDIIGGISQSLSTLGSVASFIGDIFGWNKSGVDDWVKQFDRLGVSISENIVEQIKEAKKAGERASTVQAKLTDQIIEQGVVTAENMQGYKRLVQDIFMEIDNGRLTGIEAVNEVSDAFLALANKAQEAGLAGSKALSDLLNDARNRGLVSDDMKAWLDSVRGTGLSAMSAHIAGTSGTQEGFDAAQRQMQAFFESMLADGKSTLEIIDALGPAIDQIQAIGKEKGYDTDYLSSLLGLREFVEDNRDVISGIQATQSVMDSMAQTGILTQERFTEFAASAYDYYKQLTAEGKNGGEAIQALLPMLSKQLWYAQEYGYELDDNTKKLIEEAKAQGLKLDAAIPAEERMAQGIEKLVALFEQLTGGINQSTEAIKGMGSEIGKITVPKIDDGSTEYTGFAVGTSGYQKVPRTFYVHRDERVDMGPRGTVRVTPQGSGGMGGGQAMTINLNLPNVRDPYSAKQLKEDLALNRDGLQTALRRAVN